MDRALDLTQMNPEQLAEALREAQKQLSDLLEERRITLGQTGRHIGPQEFAQLSASWAGEEARLTERITAIRELLAAI